MDFYSDDLSKLTIEDVKSFLGVDGETGSFPSEGTTIDYKEAVPQDIGDDVAAMSNTRGGLIFIGVKSEKAKQNIAVSIPGAKLRPDAKADLTNRILSTVHPRPHFDIAILSMSDQRYVALIRVREGNFPPYEYSQGSTVKISVREQDTNRQATLGQIESLLGKRDSFGQPRFDTLSKYFETIPSEVLIFGELGHWKKGARQQAICVANVPLRIVIDAGFERAFEGLISTYSPTDRAYWKEFRRGGFYMIFHRRDQLRIWEAWSEGAIRFRSTLGPKESIGDLIQDMLCFLHLSHALLNREGYFGNCMFANEIVCHDVKFLPLLPPHNDRMKSIQIPEPKPQFLEDHVSYQEEVQAETLQKPEELVARVIHDEIRELTGARVNFRGLQEVTRGLAEDLRSRLRGE